MFREKSSRESLIEISKEIEEGQFDPRPITVRGVRRWSTEKLYVVIHGVQVSEVIKGMCRTEIETREQWRRPGAWSVIIATLSLVVAIAALFRSFVV